MLTHSLYTYLFDAFILLGQESRGMSNQILTKKNLTELSEVHIWKLQKCLDKCMNYFFLRMRYFSDRLRNETNGIKIVTMLLVRCFVDSNVVWIFPFGSSINICQMLKHKKINK